jgi:hypothetical protein
MKVRISEDLTTLSLVWPEVVESSPSEVAWSSSLPGQFVPPRHPGTNGGGRSKFIKTEALTGEKFVLGVKPLRPPARIVFRRLEVEIIDVLAHLAV